MWLQLACADADRTPAPELEVGIGFVAAEQPVRDSAIEQHHATVSVGDGGEDHVTWWAGVRTVEAQLEDGLPGDPTIRFPTATTSHPQLAFLNGATWLVARATRGGLVGGPLDEAAVAFGEGERSHPDVAGFGDGVLVAAGGVDGLVVEALGRDGRSRKTAELPYQWSRGGTPAIRAVADGWRVVWAEGDLVARSGVRAAYLDAAGALREEPEWVADWAPFDDDARPALATGPSGEAIAWRQGSRGEAWLELRDLEGTLVARHALHTDGPAGRPALAAMDDTLFVAWEQQRSDGWVVRLQARDLATGEVLGPAVQVSTPSGIPGRPAVAVDASGRGVVSWETTSDLEGVTAVWVRAFALQE